MVEKFIDWLIDLAKRTPYVHLPGYMNRWWLIPYNRFIPSMRIHEILRSDSDRAYHDHPWWYLSIILRGGYFECRPLYDKSGLLIGHSRKWYGPGSIILRPARSWHRLEIPEGTIATTLFMTGRYVNQWGFLPEPKTKVYYREYLNLEQKTEVKSEH